jgi:predicted nuclease of predicted toxin-antitoxin system
MERASDLEVWRYAKEHDYVIVSKDSDFYDLSLLYDTPPKVVWLKSGNVSKSAVTHLLLTNREQIQSMLAQTEISCIEIY